MNIYIPNKLLGSQEDNWRQANIYLEDVSVPFQLLFRGVHVRGRGGIAVDDYQLEPCAPSPGRTFFISN